MKVYVFTTLILISCACSEPDTAEKDAFGEVQQMEDSLRKMTSGQNLDAEAYKKFQKRYAQKLISAYQSFPSNKNAAQCIDKAQGVYTEIHEYFLAAQWADTLINKYPKYSKRALVLESQALAFDAFIQPRDSAKVRLYYSMLLNEFPKLDKEKREGIKRRLQHNEMNFDEYIDFQMMVP